MCRFTDVCLDAIRRKWQLLALALVVATIYFPRLTAVPVRGEETRWAEGAINMIHSGDWIVPRQQGEPFIDRPPLASWSMAAVGVLRGKLDTMSIRLPSVLALLLTAIVIYTYSRTFLAPTGAVAAGAAFASLVQVLQIGRFGENEALYTLLVCGALLTWHSIYVRGGSRALAWSIGCSIAGLAALQKGIQAPVYFFAGVGTFLLLRRDWRWIFCWGHLLGWCCMAAVIAAWWIPFYRATNLHTAIEIWTATVTRRFGSSGLISHVLTYPLETLACLLPWSVLLLGVVYPSVRRALGRPPQQIVFVCSAMLLPYASLLAAANGRARYFMPLYPLVAVVIGWFVERCALCEPQLLPRRRWNLFLLVIAMTGVAGAVGLVVLSYVPNLTSYAAAIQQTPAISILVLVCATAMAGVMLWARRTPGPLAVEIGALAVAATLGLAYTGPIINVQVREANDMTEAITNIKTLVPDPEHIVSLGPIHHRFAWYYGTPIERLPWPTKPTDLSENVTYFYMEWSHGDTAEWRSMGPGLFDPPAPGTLPFAWEKVAFLPCDPTHTSDPQSGVILGRVIRTPQTAERHDCAEAARR